VLADRTEALVYILAHDLRHMWQQHGTMKNSSFPVERVKNAHGMYSEICTGGLGRWRWVVDRTFAWLNQFRRLRVRYEKRADIHEVFLSLGCALICWHFLSRLGGGSKLALPVID
jgi:transposase